MSLPRLGLLDPALTTAYVVSVVMIIVNDALRGIRTEIVVSFFVVLIEHLLKLMKDEITKTLDQDIRSPSRESIQNLSVRSKGANDCTAAFGYIRRHLQ
jgi:hypothetical protein